MKKYFRVFTLLALLSVNSVHAEFLVEPYVGFLRGEGEKTVAFNDGSGSLKMDSEYFGPSYGARLGYETMGLIVGLDYSSSSYEVEAKARTSNATWNSNTIGTEKYDVDDAYLGIFVSYQAPVLFRLWGTYFLAVERKLTSDSNGTGIFKRNDKMEGTGFAIGIGYTAMPFVSINLEYRTIDFEQNTGGVDTTSPTGRKYDSTDSQMLLSVSLPFHL